MPDPSLRMETPEAWREWLLQNHATSSGVWLEIGKKNSGLKTVTYAEALEEALCFGWIDGQVRGVSPEYFVQRFCPRKRDSIWSRVNRDKALQLIASGRMQPGGLEAIERAKANGRWDSAYEGSKTAVVPDDLAAALHKNKKAAAFFSKLSSQNRYAILFRLQRLKTPAARAGKIAKYVEMLARGESLHPQ